MHELEYARELAACDLWKRLCAKDSHFATAAAAHGVPAILVEGSHFRGGYSAVKWDSADIAAARNRVIAARLFLEAFALELEQAEVKLDHIRGLLSTAEMREAATPERQESCGDEANEDQAPEPPT